MAGIYLHIPFCKKMCHYCDFYHIISPGEHSEFIASIISEAEQRKEYTGTETISTIYIGGGTPSVLATGEIEKILNALYRIFKIDQECEITIELNPDDVTREFTGQIKELGINRISLGVQSFRDTDLKLLKMLHWILFTEYPEWIQPHGPRILTLPLDLISNTCQHII